MPGIFDAVPAAYDLDGDGVDEIIGHNNDTNVYVFHGQTGRAVATLPTTYPSDWHIERILNGVAAGVLEPGQAPSVVIANHAAYVSAWRLVPGESSQDSFVFERSWEVRTNDCFENSGMDAAPMLADLDGDGSLEIVVQSEEVGLFALRSDGTYLWKHCWAGGNSDALIEDLDGDGSPEVVFAADNGKINVLAGDTGDGLWSFDAADPAHGVSPASVPVRPTAAELDGEPPMEILFTARHAPADDPDRYDDYHMAIFAIHQDPHTYEGDLVWKQQPDWAHPLSYTHLIVDDVDDDGSPDIFGMDWNTIGHKPGNWENLGLAHVFRLDADGNDVWVQEVDSWWSNKDIAVADFDADGDLEVLVNGALNGQDGLYRLSVSDGEIEAFLPIWPWKLLRGPLVVDLRHDGALQVAFPVTPDEVPETGEGAILVLELVPSGGFPSTNADANYDSQPGEAT